MAANIILRMDIKKTKKADLESGRVTWFLLGLILVLAAFFVVFEYTDSPAGGGEEAEDALGDLPAHDDGLVPMMLPHATLRVMEAAPAPDEAAQRMKIVDNDAAARTERDPLEELRALMADQGAAQMDDGQLPDPADTASVSARLMDDRPLDFRVVESLPQFPGGAVEFMKWLTRNLRYPLAAERQKIEGRVVVQFIVERDGAISGLKVARAAHPYLDREAMRVLRTMPKWQPGMQNDRPCRTMVSIPVVFKL